METQNYKTRLDEYWNNLNKESFVKNDPVSIVREIAANPDSSIADIEITAIWAASVAWGRRTMIISNILKLMDLCQWHPAEFVRARRYQTIPDDTIIHRTLKGSGFKALCDNLYDFYKDKLSIQAELMLLEKIYRLDDLMQRVCSLCEPAKLGNPRRQSACKRINMLLRWMVRKDAIDLGIWRTKYITPANLYAVVDVHVARQAYKMGLISQPKEGWKAVLELTSVYQSWDSIDPLKYDMVLMQIDLLDK